MRDLLTADPDEIAPAPAEDEREQQQRTRAARPQPHESGSRPPPTTDGAQKHPTSDGDSTQRQHPPPLASHSPPTFSALTAPRRSDTGTAHDTPRPSLLSPSRPISRPKHSRRRQFRHISPPISQPRTSAATVSRSHSALIQPRPPLDISEMFKKRNDHTPA